MLAAKYGIDIHGPVPEEAEGFGTQESPAGDLKSLNHRWIQAFNERDWQTECAVRGESFQAYLSGFAEPLDNAAWSGFMADFTAGFPDSRIAIESCNAEGDAVVTRWTLTGTHLGTFQGIPPTGRPVNFPALNSIVWSMGGWSSIGRCSITLLCYSKLARCRRSASGRSLLCRRCRDRIVG